ncbi:hypothetical protein VISI1226_18491 [Vibrio sinaloensis DSM 21326]|uniref:Uncharacterized protein n=1 Tax=Vibrio sinaloensis DSM 21326 TaxID=945550 RepID=E8MCC2_PHOS4|nr:hypothetical protein VISI1226_18491 [Vibrio sinaloensis DSM 21326]
MMFMLRLGLVEMAVGVMTSWAETVESKYRSSPWPRKKLITSPRRN